MSDVVEEVQEAVAKYELLGDQSTADLTDLTATVMKALQDTTLTDDDRAAIVSAVSGLIEIPVTMTSRDSIGDVSSVLINPIRVQIFVQAMIDVVKGLGIDSQAQEEILGGLTEALNTAWANGGATVTAFQSLWTTINTYLDASTLHSVPTATFKQQYQAMLKILWNASYSDLLTRTVPGPFVSSWYMGAISEVSSTNNLTTDEVGKCMEIFSALFSSIVDDSGMVSGSNYVILTDTFISDVEAFLDEASLDSFYSTLKGYLQSSFSVSETYVSGGLYTPSAATLTSSVTPKFGIGAADMAPSSARDFFSTTYNSIFQTLPNPTIDLYEAIQLLYQDLLLTVTAVPLSTIGETLTSLQKILGDNDVSQEDIADITASYLVAFQQSLVDSLSVILQATVPVADGVLTMFDDIANVVESITGGDEIHLGTYTEAFLDSLYQNLLSAKGLDLYTVALLKLGVNSILTTNDIPSVGISGNGFLQLGCEILLFLQDFLTQDDLDSIGSGLNSFLSTFEPISGFVDYIDNGLTIAVIVLAAATIITLTAGAGAAAGVAAAGSGAAAFVATASASLEAGGYVSLGASAATAATTAATLSGAATAMAVLAGLGTASAVGVIAVGVYLGMENAGIDMTDPIGEDSSS